MQPSIIDLIKHLQGLIDQMLRFFRGYRYRSSRPERFYEKSVLKNFIKLIGKQLGWSLLYNKVASWKPVALLKKGLRHRCRPENFAKLSRITILWNNCEPLFLYLPH